MPMAVSVPVTMAVAVAVAVAGAAGVAVAGGSEALGMASLASTGLILWIRHVWRPWPASERLADTAWSA